MDAYEHVREELTLSEPADHRDVARLRSDYGMQVPDDYSLQSLRPAGAPR